MHMNFMRYLRLRFQTDIFCTPICFTFHHKGPRIDRFFLLLYCFMYEIWKLYELKGTVRSKKKNLSYSFNCDENLHTHVKSKIKWNNRHELLSIFFIENELSTET